MQAKRLLREHVGLPLGFVAVAALLLAAACGGSSDAPRVASASGQGASPVSTPTTLTASGQRAAWVAYAACLRQHGANVPDPTFDQNGNPQWATPNDSQPPAARQACASHLQGLGGGKGQAGPPTAAQLAKEIRFAQCLRQHGYPDWPDPDPHTGGFPHRQNVYKTDPNAQVCLQGLQ